MNSSKVITLLLLIFLSNQAWAQHPDSDIYKTSSQTLEVQPILHGTLVLTYNDITIYVDPYGGAKAFENIAPADIVLITDIHGDHLNMTTLNDIKVDDAQFITPQAVADKLPSELKQNLNVLNNMDSLIVKGISIRAIPMYNLPESEESRHPKGRGNGYILTIDNQKIYISGDTEDIVEMRQLKNIDIAFICMNLPYTMDIHQASSAVLDFKPKTVYPYHYRGKPEMSDIKAFKKLVNTKDNSIQVVLKDWYPNY